MSEQAATIPLIQSIKGAFSDAFQEELKSRLKKQEEDASEKKRDYAKSLEEAKDAAGIFKCFLLISISQIDGYVAQTRSQAQLTFALCKRVAFGAFIIIVVGVVLAIVERWFGGGEKYTAAWLAAISGVLTQMISGVFFYFHNRTLEQFNMLTEKLTVAQDTAIALLAASTIGNADKRDQCNSDLIQLLLARGAQRAAPSKTSAGKVG